MLLSQAQLLHEELAALKERRVALKHVSKESTKAEGQAGLSVAGRRCRVLLTYV